MTLHEACERRVYSTPEEAYEALVKAIVRQAELDAQASVPGGLSPSAHHRRLDTERARRDAQRWLMECGEHPGGFGWCCDWLGHREVVA